MFKYTSIPPVESLIAVLQSRPTHFQPSPNYNLASTQKANHRTQNMSNFSLLNKMKSALPTLLLATLTTALVLAAPTPSSPSHTSGEIPTVESSSSASTTPNQAETKTTFEPAEQPTQWPPFYIIRLPSTTPPPTNANPTLSARSPSDALAPGHVGWKDHGSRTTLITWWGVGAIVGIVLIIIIAIKGWKWGIGKWKERKRERNLRRRQERERDMWWGGRSIEVDDGSGRQGV
jgi:hypothetical protein